jgi:histone acetyltransferase (RNA polymerase elongator complex component)
VETIVGAASYIARNAQTAEVAFAVDDQFQGRGLGTQLLDAAKQMSRDAGFRRISVIAATGTRAYYAARGFRQDELYMNGVL